MEVEIDLHAVEFAQAALREAPEVLDPVDVDAVSFREFAFSVVHPEMLFARYVDQSVISPPAVRIKDAFVEIHFSLDDRTEGFRLAVRDDFRVDFDPSVLVFPLL